MGVQGVVVAVQLAFALLQISAHLRELIFRYIFNAAVVTSDYLGVHHFFRRRTWSFGELLHVGSRRARQLDDRSGIELFVGSIRLDLV